ncbi:MAG: fibronectin type III-like domain-contianing protein [Bacteroidaceae bacterium]|nr:fibronectin type III-like domain-contianing protein [Bacteroidaceae bacterium]
MQPLLQLKAFQRIVIPRDETLSVTFTLTPDDFAIIDRHLRRVVEPGDFTIL